MQFLINLDCVRLYPELVEQDVRANELNQTNIICGFLMNLDDLNFNIPSTSLQGTKARFFTKMQMKIEDPDNLEERMKIMLLTAGNYIVKMYLMKFLYPYNLC